MHTINYLDILLAQNQISNTCFNFENSASASCEFVPWPVG